MGVQDLEYKGNIFVAEWKGCTVGGPREAGPAHGVTLLLPLLLAATMAPPSPRTPVLLDTDIGTDIDDAWAVAYTLTRDDFDLVAVTITDGDTSARARVASKLLHAAGRHRGAGGGRAADAPAAGEDRLPVPVGRGFHGEGPDRQARGRGDRGRGTEAAGRARSRRGRPAPERGRRPAPGATAPGAGEASRAHERLRLHLNLGPRRRVERHPGPRGCTARLRRGLPPDHRAPRLDHEGGPEAGGTGAPA